MHETRDHGIPQTVGRRTSGFRIFDECASLRSPLKPAVMVKPYGGSTHGIRDDVEDFWEEADGEVEWLDLLHRGETELPKLHR